MHILRNCLSRSTWRTLQNLACISAYRTSMQKLQHGTPHSDSDSLCVQVCLLAGVNSSYCCRGEIVTDDFGDA